MVRIKPGLPGHVFGRGDYGSDYAIDVIDLIEERNCSLGCRHGDPANPDHPGGTCDILLRVATESPVPEIDPRADGPVCTRREPLGGAS